MRHRNATKILSRKSHARKALLRSLLTSFALHGRMTTSKAKAKTVQPQLERLITAARKGTLAGRRYVQKTLYTEKAVKAMVETVAPKVKGQSGGYTRIVKIGRRKGDGADVVRLELTA